ncbi:MAG TPA: hypothetical protein VGM94_15100 [Galbitalea sp.]
MNGYTPLAQAVLGALSLPLVATVGGWLLSRLSAERRLLAQVERLAHIYPSIPESLAKVEYAERVTAAVSARCEGIRRRVYAQSTQSASLERIPPARKYWRISAIALTHRLHSLGLLSEWQYRSTRLTLSDRGFRSGEPGGIVRESSFMLRKLLYGDSKLGLAAVSSKLAIDMRDLASLMQGLVPVAT